MKPNFNILEEIQQIAPSILQAEKKMPYKIPEHYFDGFAEQLQAKISLQSKQVPAGYFERLPMLVLEKIKQQQELNEFAPTLANLPKLNVYRVPELYFEQFNAKPTSVVKMQWPKKMALAAVVIGLLGFALHFYFKYNSNQTQAYAQMEAANKILKNSTVEAEIGKLTDVELEQYLLQTGTDVEAGIAATTAFEDKIAIDVKDDLFSEDALNELIEKEIYIN
jgi:hypothetical protein